MEEESNWWVWVIIIGIVWLLFFNNHDYEGQSANEWYDEYESSQEELNSTQDALDEANSNIEEAKYSAWESYDEMGEALDSLETVNP